MIITKDTHSVINYIEAGLAVAEECRSEDYSWYSYAREQVLELSELYSMDTVLVSALAAGASRSCTVEENFRRLCLYLEEGDVIFCGDYLNRIVERYNYGLEPVCPVSSPKVYNFHKCLLDGDSDKVVLDRHAISLVTNEKSSATPSKTTRSRCLRAYRKASKATGLQASKCQSFAWIGYRVEKLGMNPMSPHHHSNAFADYCIADYAKQELRYS